METTVNRLMSTVSITPSKTSLKGWKPDELPQSLQIINFLKNFLKGMETAGICWSAGLVYDLKNFLKGMETCGVLHLHSAAF